LTDEAVKDDAGGLRIWEPWSKLWAPFWSFYEDQHLSTGVLDDLAPILAGPVLLVGSGQGLILERLRAMGLQARGIDFSRDMVRMGAGRRGVRSILADAGALPFARRSFRTVIIASGVVDYLDDEPAIRRIIGEGLRVVAPLGHLIVTFYSLSEDVARAYRRLGVIDSRGRFRMRRMFRMARDADLRRLGVGEFFTRFVPMLGGWAGTSYAATMARLTWTGLTLPAYLRENGRKLARILDRVQGEGLDAEKLVESVPDDLPLRGRDEVARLLSDAGLGSVPIDLHDDCIIARHYVTPVSRPRAGARRGRAAPVIAARDLVKSYGRTTSPAVDHVNLSVEPGSIVGLLGPNGAGKTTLLLMLCGLLPPTGGSIDFALDGARIGARKLRRILGYVPQDLALYDRLTGDENLEYFGGLYGLEGEQLRERAGNLLSLVGLTGRAGDHVRRYSTGMKRRLNLAIGLINDPRIILLDEPTVGIDPQSRACIFEAVRDLKRRGAAILLTTHIIEDAARLCDSVAIMDRGRILLEGAPADLVSRYGLGRMVFRTLDPVPSDVLRVIAGMDGVVGVDRAEGRLTVLVTLGERTSVEMIGDILEAAGEKSPDLSLTTFLEPSLEGLFLDVTGRSLRAETPPPVIPTSTHTQLR